MAGDWIKMRSDLQTHPKVVRMASALKADRLRVVGGLHAVWSLFDMHSEDGVLDGYTRDALDESIGFAGFSEAMIKVGWLSTDGESLMVPRFDEHNGQSAKRRSQETQRKREARKESAPDADKMRSREEKRREDLEPKPSVDSDAIAPTGDLLGSIPPLPCPAEKLLDLYHAAMPDNPRVKILNAQRRKTLASRWREASRMTCKPFGYETTEQGLAAWKLFFEVCAESDFLTGKAKPTPGKIPFLADIDFIFSPQGFVKCLENKYHREAA